MKFSGGEGKGYGVSQIIQLSINFTASLLLTLSQPHPSHYWYSWTYKEAFI